MKHYVAGFLFDEAIENVVLVRKDRPEIMKDKLNAVGGKIEDYDLSPEAAMIREFKEEAGVQTGYWNFFTDLTGEGFIVNFFYLVDQNAFDKAYSAEREEIVKLSLEDVQKHSFVENADVILEEIKNHLVPIRAFGI